MPFIFFEDKALLITVIFLLWISIAIPSIPQTPANANRPGYISATDDFCAEMTADPQPGNNGGYKLKKKGTGTAHIHRAEMLAEKSKTMNAPTESVCVKNFCQYLSSSPRFLPPASKKPLVASTTGCFSHPSTYPTD